MEYLPYILALLALLIVAVQFYLYFMAKGAQGRALPACDELLDEAQRGAPQLLFYFHSEQCPPCRRMTPLLEAEAARSGKVVIVDVAAHHEAARRFGVLVTPTLMRVRDGIIDKVVVGGVSEAKLQKLLAIE